VAFGGGGQMVCTCRIKAWQKERAETRLNTKDAEGIKSQACQETLLMARGQRRHAQELFQRASVHGCIL